MRRKGLVCGIVGAMAWLSACSPVPDGILSQKDMQAVLTDMQIAEGIISSDNETYKDDAQKLALYESVFRKHHITRAEYDSSLMWYARNLDIYMRVYNMVSDDIRNRIDNLGDVQRIDTEVNNNDSVDIWPRRPYLTFIPKAPFNGTIFDLKPKQPYPPGSSFVLSMHIWGINPSMKHKPEIRLCVEQNDTTIVINEQIRTDGYHETMLKSLPTKRVKRVYGYIRLDNKDMNYYKIYTDSIRLMRYNFKSVGFKKSDKK